MPLVDKLLLRKRTIAEAILDQLKSISQIEHTRHCSVNSFVVNLLAADCLLSSAEKPSLHLILQRDFHYYETFDFCGF